MTTTDADRQLLESYAIERARQEAERKHVERYTSSGNPERILREAIYEILASTTSGILDRELSDPIAPSIPEWQADMRTRMLKRLESDFVFSRLVAAQTKMIEEEVLAYHKALSSDLEERVRIVLDSKNMWMDKALTEREDCARIAEGPIFGLEHGTPEGCEIARLIRARK